MPKSTKKTKAKKRSRKVRARPANYDDIQRALTKHVAEVLENIPLERVQLSQPIDGKGARLRASVEAGNETAVPSSIKLKLGRKTVSIPIETLADYEETKAL